MRTLEEMKTDLDKIEEDLTTVAGIASLARPYTNHDLATWNAIVPITADRISALDRDIGEAAITIGNYSKQIVLDLYLRKCLVGEARSELNRASEIHKVLRHFNETLESQSTRFNAYQEQALKHP